MAQYKLRKKPGSDQPVVSKWGSGLNVIAVLICALLAVLIWLSAIRIEYREQQEGIGSETDGIEVFVPMADGSDTV